MKLKYAIAESDKGIVGVSATIIRNALIGDLLVVEGGKEVINVKISDLIDAILEQENTPEEKVEAKVETSN